MGYNPVLAKRALRGPWQCIDCKICIVCTDAGDPVSKTIIMCKDIGLSKNLYNCNKCEYSGACISKVCFMCEDSDY